MILYQLLRPYAYLQIEHPKKYIYDWVIPFLLTAFFLVICLIFVDYDNYFSSSGLISKFLDFVEILPGFYIAALAAIATFQRNDIDQHMPNPAPKLNIKIKGKDQNIELTRRRFLCMLFSFLTAHTIIFAILAILLIQIVPETMHYTSQRCLSLSWVDCRMTISIIYLLPISFIFWQIITATFHGLYYLGDRLHQPD